MGVTYRRLSVPVVVAGSRRASSRERDRSTATVAGLGRQNVRPVVTARRLGLPPSPQLSWPLVRIVEVMPISEITRRAIIDELSLSKISWSGRMEEPDFLARLYRLKDLPSTDGRFNDAAGDIWQHRVNNFDWDDDWVFYDPRFSLMEDDEEFLRFLAETVHPVVRPNHDEVAELLRMYNEHLRHDGWEIREVSQISGRPVFAAHNRLTVPPALGQVEKSIKAGGHGISESADHADGEFGRVRRSARDRVCEGTR